MPNIVETQVVPTQTERAQEFRGEAPQRNRFPSFLCINDVRMDAQITEASGYDLRVRLRESVSRGQTLQVAFLAAIPTSELVVPGVVHWTGAEDGAFEAGIALVEPVPADYLARHPGCQRSNLRFQCGVPGEVRWTATRSSQSVTIRNYSRDGLCLLCPTSPTVGARFILACETAGTRTLEGQVSWVIAQDGQHLVGCELTSGLGYLISGVEVELVPAIAYCQEV